MPTLSSPSPAGELPCPVLAVDDFLSEPTPGVHETLRDVAGPILVLGAGGKMGLHLSAMLRRGLDHLGRRRERVLAVSRFSTLRDRAEFQTRGIETLTCDLSDPAAVAALPDAPTVFFLAGVKFGTANDPALLHRMNAVMPRLVAERFAASRIVAFSTGCVYPFVSPASGGASEQTPVAPVGDYARSCVAREEAFAAVSRLRGTRVALLRLNYSVEFRYGVLLDIGQKVFAGEPVDVTTGYVNIIWQRDAVAYAIRALELAASPAAPVNVTGTTVLPVREIAGMFHSIFGGELRIAGTETATAWLNNASAVQRKFGPPPTSLTTMVRWVAAWLQRSGEVWGKPTGFEKRDGKF